MTQLTGDTGPDTSGAQSEGYWPYADDQGEYGEKLNNLTKFVASSKLDDAPWGDFPTATVTRYEIKR